MNTRTKRKWLTIEATIAAPALTQWVANRAGGGAQQSTTVKVIFVPLCSGLVELVIFTFIP